MKINQGYVCNVELAYLAAVEMNEVDLKVLKWEDVQGIRLN